MAGNVSDSLEGSKRHLGWSEHLHTLSFHLILNQAFEKALKALNELQGVIGASIPWGHSPGGRCPQLSHTTHAILSSRFQRHLRNGCIGGFTAIRQSENPSGAALPQSLALSSAHLFLPLSTGAGRVAQLPLVPPCLPRDGAVIRNYSARSRDARSNKPLDLLWTCCCSHPLQPSFITVLPCSLCGLSL